MVDVLRLEVPEPIPSLNRVYGRHWSAKYRQRKQWGWLIRAALLDVSHDSEHNLALLALRGHVCASGRVGVRAETWRPRVLDRDNLIAGAKGIIDCLRAECLIVDDSPKWIEETVVQHVGMPHRTVLELTPI